MDLQHWQRVSAIFDEVAEAEPEARAELLQRLCADDNALRGDVETLLTADAGAAGFDRGVDFARAAVAIDWANREERGGLASGQRIGPWAVVRELGRGGMGVVLLAGRADGAFEQQAAIKLIKRGMDSDAVQARFLRERQILARLEHPHIAHLLDGGVTTDGRPYFAMEYVDGQPLLHYCAQRNAALEERLGIFLDICTAVQFAHGRLVVHRDIKPSNILVTQAGQAKLLDFGIAKLLDESGAGATIDAAHRPLTPAYAAPEQLLGDPVTVATDVYALGGVLYELLTGRRPLAVGDAPTPEEMTKLQATIDPATPSSVVGANVPVTARRLRGDLDTILIKALQREPQRRYATVGEFADDLRRHLAGQPIVARRDQTGYRVKKFIARHRFGVAAAALGTLLLVAALGAALWQARAKAREAETSQQVTQFLSGLFKGADPELSQGATLSAQDLLDQGTLRLRSDLPMQADVRARLLDTVAATYVSLGLYDRALPLAQQALKLRRDGASELDRADSLFELGRILRLKARYADAGPLLDEALQLRRRHLAADDPAVIESLRERGGLLRGRGEFAQADAAFDEALRLAQQHYGVESPASADAEDDYAANLDDMGRRADAIAHYRHALAVREKQLGPDAAETASSLLNLGVHLDESADYEQAVPLLERAVAVRKKIFGAEHPLVGIAEIGLAGAYQDQERLDDAEQLSRQALAIFRSSLPPEHPRIGEALNLLAMVSMLRRDYVTAVPLAQEVLERSRKVLGVAHPDTLTAENNLGYALSRAGRAAEAEALFRDVLERKSADNGQFVDVKGSENLATALVEQRKFAEAVAYERHALKTIRQRDGEASGNAAVALRCLAAAEQWNGAFDDAERDFRAALAIGEALKHTHKVSTTNEWKIPLADLLVGTGRCAEAVPLLQDGLAEFGADAHHFDPIWEPEAHLLHGQCLGKAGAAEQRAARAALHALPGIEVDLCPTARKLLHSQGSVRPP